MKKSKNKNLTPFAISVFIVLALYALTIFITLYFGLLTSLKGFDEFKGDLVTGARNILGFPQIGYNKEMDSNYHLFYNYQVVFQNFAPRLNEVGFYNFAGTKIVHEGYTAHFGHFMLNTFIYAILCPMLTALITTVTAYLCCKYDFWFSKFWYTYCLITMTIPLIGTAPALVNILRNLGIYDTYFAMIVMNMHGGGLYFFVFFAFFKGLSDTYIEAAEIDGASQARVLINIILPMAWKTMLTVFIILMVGLWNTYEAPMLYYPTKPTLAYAVFMMVNDTGMGDIGIRQLLQSVPVKLAGCMILSIPTLVLFLCLKTVIMGNLTLGGLKE